MSAVTNTDHVVAGNKRKRTTRSSVNYADLVQSRISELELEEYLNLDDESAEEEADDDLPNGDTMYGSRNKPSKTKKSQGKKRARLTLPRPKKAEKPFPFLSLPPELRNYIYELALVEPEGITIVSKFRRHRRIVARGPVYDVHGNCYRRRRYHDSHSQLMPQEKSINTALLAVNKQMHAETIKYLYQQPLILEDTMALHSFLAAIGPTNRLQLKELVVRGWGVSRGTYKAMNFASLTLLAGCINLQMLHLDCSIGWFRGPINLARQIYREGHYFFEAYGLANGACDAAMNVLKLKENNFDISRRPWGARTDLRDQDDFKTQFEDELRRLLSR